ncbi:T9SS C-terminal target domain-containing protein [candidate division KSB1 bacterium]|nr:T9SS type A sorting domain-containing protein [candidate division KSB1 bacterium]RQW06835.1 MAG: T9SS C-terminal target domain-containing protein [candidate division KSB1 bacterium]
MCYRRILIVCLVVLLVAAVLAREPETTASLEKTDRSTGAAGCYEAIPEAVGDSLSYTFWDHIVVHSGLDTSRCIILKDVPFSGEYKIYVVASYSKYGGIFQDKEEYQLGIYMGDSILFGPVIRDQNSPIDSLSGIIVKENTDYLWVQNDHDFRYLKKGDNKIRFKTGGQFAGAGKSNSVDFRSILIVPPPHIIQEPRFTAGTSNTIEWKPLQSDAVMQEVVCFDNTPHLAKNPQATRSQRQSMSGSTNTRTFEGLSDGHEYGYYVEASLVDGRMVRSKTTFSTQDATPPPRVRIASMSAYWNKHVRILWDEVEDAVSYVTAYQIIRLGSNGQTDIDTLDTISAKKPCWVDSLRHYCYIDTLTDPQAANKKYTYRVDAIDSVYNRSVGFPSEVVVEILRPSIESVPKPDSLAGLYYRGTTVTIRSDVAKVFPKEVHEIRFEAVRDSVKLFDGQFGKGRWYFDSDWISLDTTKKYLFYSFDLTAGGQNAVNFVNGRFYYFRLQIKDNQGNFSQYSDTLTIVPDCYPPSDVTYLTVNPMANADNTVGWFDITWGAASDLTSGVKNYLVYRKIADGDYIEIAQPTETCYVDSFAVIGYNKDITYFIGSEDLVGNRRTESKHKFSSRCQVAPIVYDLSFQKEVDGERYTSRPFEHIILDLPHFDLSDSLAKIVLRINELDSVEPGNIAERNDIGFFLPQNGLYCIKARVLFGDKSTSMWTEPQYITKVPKDSLEAQSPAGSSKEKDVMVISNYPNPFNMDTKITFNLPQDAHVLVEVYNVQGRRIRVLNDGYQSQGRHSVHWDGTNNAGNIVASGLYYYRVKIKPENESAIDKIQSMLLVK